MRTASPRDREFWMNESVVCEKDERVDYEQEASKHFFKALDIAAAAFAEAFHKKALTETFPEFYKEFVYIRALSSWESFKAISEEEKKELQEEMERQKKEAEEYNKDLEESEESFMVFDLTQEDPDVKVLRFAEIMEKLPEQITDEEKAEAFELYPKIFALMAS